MEVSVTEKDDDSLFRRSSRKRRKINYRSEKQLRVIVKKENETDHGKPKKRGRPRKKPSLEEDTECKPATKCLGTTKKHCKKYGLDEIDVMIGEYIKLEDEDGMKRIISSLQCALQRTPKKSISVNGSMKSSSDVAKEAQTPVKQNVNKTVEIPRTTAENPHPQTMNPVNLQPATSIPANLQTKSISVHGNSVIMQGVIDTGMAQTSCFLIPIDIGNFSQIPGGIQVIQSPSPQMISPNIGQSPVLIPINQQPPQNLPQQQQPHNHLQQQPVNLPKQHQLPVVTQHQTQSSSVQQQQLPLKSLPQLKPQQKQPQNDLLSNPVPTTSIGNDTGLLNGHRGTSPTNKQNTNVNRNKAISVKDKNVSLKNTNKTASNAPLVVEKVPAASQGPVDVSTVDKSLAHLTNTNKKSAPSSLPADPVDAVVESLQSTESLSQIIDQLSQDDMVSIINILTNNNTTQATTSTVPSATTTAPDTMSTDLAKLASDVEKLSKLEPDQLSTGVVNQLVAELSKLLTGTNSTEEGQDKLLSKLVDTAMQEEDEDFQHVQIEQQHAEQVNNTSGLKCYMCGLLCVDQRAFITHMRFHLFNYRYSCYECGFGTSSMNELLLHKAEEHEGDLTKISPDLLKQLPKSERASIPDLEETLIQCPECKDNIALNSLSAHMNQKHKPLHKASPGRKPKCTICTALVENKLELAAHVKHHGKEDNSFACYFCTQTYHSISSLQLHTTNYHASLAAKRHYKCTQCAREFSGSYHLIRHVKTVHEQRRDYQCSKCDKSFVELHCLRRHIRNIHNLIRDHTCPVCNRGFTYRQDMFRHIMSVHQKIRDIKCPLCSEKFYHRYFIGHAYRQHDLKVKYRDGICYIYDDAGNVIHKIT
ncbi:hypothetical protein ACHWQZ_G001864 [Mnemiopsis leidyi]